MILYASEHTKAVTPGFAIGSAVIAAVSLLASFIRPSPANWYSTRRFRIVPRPATSITVAISYLHRTAYRGRGALRVLALAAGGSRTAGSREEVRVRCDGNILSWETRPTTAPSSNLHQGSRRDLTTPGCLRSSLP